MGSRRNLLVVLVLVGSSTAGCLGDAELIGEESQEICVGSGCMPNSANINGMPVDELHLDGLANPSGMSFQHVKRANGDVMPLHVEGSRLYAIDTTQSSPQYLPLVAGDKLVVRDTSTGEEHYLQILSSSWMNGWWQWDTVFMTYQIGYQDPNLPMNEFIPICNQPPINDPSWTGFETTAVFFRGERYSEKDKTVTETGDQVRLWFNIACAGTALMKMYRMGYDPELPDTHERYSKPEHRQITLKMITADYCGTGRSFTHSGEPMHWYNAPKWAPNLKLDPVNPPPTSNEAVWGEKGALCLDVPRLEEEYADPHDLYKEIADECGGTPPPPCSTSDLVHWASVTEWRTINGDN